MRKEHRVPNLLFLRNLGKIVLQIFSHAYAKLSTSYPGWLEGKLIWRNPKRIGVIISKMLGVAYYNIN